MDYALQVDGLCKSYAKTAFKLDNVSIAIPKGTIMGFVGKNGAGKSTTINTILDIIHKDSGSVKFWGQEMSDKSIAIRDDIGVVFDSSNFSQDLTPQKIDKVFADIYKAWDSILFFNFLKRFDIPKDKKIKTFSRGMTMKMSLVVAISHKAKFLILDEATAGLDPVAREEILDLFLEFVEDENNSILISSHISSDLEKVADYITFIDNGQIILSEAKDKLIYEYGIARMKQGDFDTIGAGEYLAARKRGLQTELLVKNKKAFSKQFPNILVDNTSIDEVLSLITREAVNNAGTN